MKTNRLEAFSDGVLAIIITLSPWVSQGVYVFVALMWLVPDRRIEKALSE